MSAAPPSTTQTDVIVFRSANWAQPNAVMPPVVARPVGIGGRFDLGPGLFIQRIGGALIRRISATVNAGGLADVIPETYSFVCERSKGDEDWDTDQRLQVAVALSRLVHPTSIAFEQSATIFGRLSDPPESVHIRAGPTLGPGATAYITDGTARNWLTLGDAEALRDLLGAYTSSSLPPRVNRALWFHEAASRQMDVAVRWALFVTAIEALISVSFDKLSKQFQVRTMGLAVEVGAAITKQQLNRAYSNRSKVDHGAATSLPANDLKTLLLIENVLRATLRKAILEPAFRDVFAEASKIEQRWPVEMTLRERFRRLRERFGLGG